MVLLLVDVAVFTILVVIFSGTFEPSSLASVLIGGAMAYTFSLASDDGSRLMIDGRKVIDHDGIHANSRRSSLVPRRCWVNSRNSSRVPTSESRMNRETA